MPSERYFYDEEILDPKLTRLCRGALEGKYAIISFRDPHDPLTGSEQKLGKDLAEECRMSLKLKGISKKRNIYFGGDGKRNPRKNPRKEEGMLLIESGHSAQAIADALGVTRSTVARWCPSKRDRGAAGHSKREYSAEVYTLGLEAMCEKEDVVFDTSNFDATLNTLAEKMWVRPDKLKRRAITAGWALKDLLASYKK